jgi:hypothetical protein
MDESSSVSDRPIPQFLSNKKNNNTKSKLYYSIKNSIKKGRNNILNEKKLENKTIINYNNEKNKNIFHTENCIKSTELSKNKKKLFFLQRNKIKSNKPELSNGEASDSYNYRYKNYYDMTKKKLLLITKKEKENNNSNKEKINNINKKESKSQNQKNVKNIFTTNNSNNNEERIKESKNLFNQYALRRRENKSKTIFQQLTEKLQKASFKSFKSRQEQELNENNIIKNNILKSENLGKLQTFNHLKEKKSTFSQYSKKDNNMNHLNLNTINTINYQFPSLELYKPIFTEKVNNFNSQKELRKSFNRNKNEISSIKKKNYLHKSVNFKESNKESNPNSLIKPKNHLYKSVNIKNNNTHSSIKEKLFFLPEKSLNENNFLIFKQKKLIDQNTGKTLSKFYRKQTFNHINTEKNKLNISINILKKNKTLNIKKNNFMKKLKKELSLGHPDNLINDLITGKKKKIVSSSLSFIKNKINIWTCKITSNISEDDQKIIFNGEENKFHKIKEQKNIKRIAKDFLKRISSPNDISSFYFICHKGLLENNILLYLKAKFFEISLPSYLFLNKTSNTNLNNLQNKNKKTLLRKNTIDHKKNNFSKQNNIPPKRGRRFSCYDSLRTKNKNITLTDNKPQLNDIIKKKWAIFFFNLDIDLDSNNILENNEKYSFLGILRSNLNNPKNQELLINKFYSRYFNGTPKNKVVFYHKKNSVKNNMINNKGTNDSLKSNKMTLFKNNFFSRNEILRSSNKIDDINKKKSMLEYNLLFDPNLTGYNNIVTDTDIIFEPNIERTIINRKKKKELKELKNRQINSLLISSGGMKTDKNIIVMKTLDLKNKYNHKNKGNINSLTSSIKDCNYDSFVKFYRMCNCGPNAIDKDGYSLLSLAVKSSCLEIVSFLLDEKANPNLQNVIIYIII